MDYEYEINNLKKRIEELESIVLKKKTEASVTLSTQRDKTKYMFNGKVYPKNRLVLAVIREYQEKFNPTYKEMFNQFDKSLQGSLNVIELLEDANKISDASKRYFMNDKDIINLCDGNKVVVCTQWGIYNIPRFVKRARELNFKIDEI